MAPLSDEENNYIRLALLLKGVSPRAVLTFFDKEFQPSNLHSTFSKNSKILRDLKLQKILNKTQWNLLFPKYGLTNSSNFDVTLMICLIRNLTTVTPPLTGFDALPTQMETTPGSDLARIKWYRNRLAHRESDTIDTVYFNTAWGHISEAVCRLGGQMMKQECQELKVKILDQSNQEIMIGIKQSMREIREMRDIMENRDRQWKEVLKQIKNQRKLIPDNKIIDLTGDECVGRRDTQRNVIDLTEYDDSKTKKRKRWDEADVIVIDIKNQRKLTQDNKIVDLTGDECVGRGDTQRNVIDLTESDDTKKRKRWDEPDVIVIHNENGTRFMHNNHKLFNGPFKSKRGEHSTAKCGGEETNRHLCSSDNSNASTASYASFKAPNQVHINPNFIGDSGESGSYADMNTPKTSIKSDYGDPTTKEFMLQPGIHVPNNKNDTPNFNNIMRIGNMQFLQQHQDTSSHFTFDNDDVKISDENEEESEPDQTRICPMHDSTRWPKFARPTLDEVLRLDNNDDILNDENGNEEGSNPNQTGIIPMHDITRWQTFDRPTRDEEFDSPDHMYLPPFPDNVSFQSSSYFKSQKKKCNWRKWIIIIFVCSCLSVVAALIVQNEYGSKKETPDDPPTPSLVVDKCESDISTATVGEQICIPYTQQFTSNPSGIQVVQVSSQYFSALPSFYINVSSDTISQKKEDWIINYNISRPDQQLRFMKENATCDSIGIYEITLEYDDGNVTSFEFEISLKDPQLKQSVTRINDKIHVHCEMIKTCMASSLALFVNDWGSSRLIPDLDVCSYTDKNSGITVSADAIIHVSQLSKNQTISCVPLMTNMALAANLTSTSGIPVCEGDCVPDCKNDPQGEAYFPDKNDCTQFYQCSNGQLVSQSCSPSTYWSTRECTCVHFDNEICNKDTNRFFNPLLSIEKCTNASLV